MISYIPDIIGGLLVSLLPWSNKTGLLVAIWLTSMFIHSSNNGYLIIEYSGFGSTGYVISLAWITSVTCGHTKRITTNAIVLIAYCCGNALGPVMWEKQYKPRCA